MGTRTEFDLDRHLTNWRKQFLADSTFYSEEVEELENHVRDGVKHLMDTGLSEEDAFYEATGRLGNPDTLRTDYKRARSLSERSFSLIRLLALCTFLLPWLIIPLTGPLSDVIHSLMGYETTMILYLSAVLLIIWASPRSALKSAGNLGPRKASLIRLLALCIFLLPWLVPLTGRLSAALNSLGGHATILVLYLSAVLLIIWAGPRSALKSAGNLGLRNASLLVIAGMAGVTLLLNLLPGLFPFTVLPYFPFAPFLAIALSWISKGRVPVWVAPALAPVLLLLFWLLGGFPALPPLMLLLLIWNALDATLGWIVGRALAERHYVTTGVTPHRNLLRLLRT